MTDISLDEMRVVFELGVAAEGSGVRKAAPLADKETPKQPIASVDTLGAAAERGDVEGLLLEDIELDLALDTQVGTFIYRASGPPGERTARDPRVAPGAAAARSRKHASAVHEARSRQTVVGSAHRRAGRGEP